MGSQGGTGLVISSAAGDIILVPHVMRGLMEADGEGEMNITLVHPVSKRPPKDLSNFHRSASDLISYLGDSAATLQAYSW